MFDFFSSIAALLAFGTLGFYILVGTIFLILGLLAEKSEPFWTTVLVITLGYLIYPIFATVSWPVIVGVALGYLIAGVLFSLWKWKNHVQKALRQNASELASKNIKSLAELMAYSEKDSGPYTHLGEFKKSINPAYNKSKLTQWTWGWVFNVVHMLTADLFDTIYELVAKTYENIVVSVFNSEFKK